MIKAMLIVSIALHALLMSYKFPKPPTKKPKPKVSKIKVKMKGKGGKNKDLFVEQLLAGLIKGLGEEKKIQKFVTRLLKRKCKNSYVGIGIHFDPVFDTISGVGVGTPAAKAGFQVGDIFVEPNRSIKDAHPIGTTITVAVLRDGIILHISVTVDKICSN